MTYNRVHSDRVHPDPSLGMNRDRIVRASITKQSARAGFRRRVAFGFIRPTTLCCLKRCQRVLNALLALSGGLSCLKCRIRI